jgi:hypothetical protein
MTAGTMCPVQESTTPLTRYLTKLLESGEHPCSPVGPDGGHQITHEEGHGVGAVQPAQRERTAHHLRAGTARPVRQISEEKTSRVQVPPGAAKPLARAAPRSRPTKKENAGDIRQKALMAVIPVLAVVLICLLKNPLRGPAVVQTQGVPSDAVVVPRHSEVAITWEVPPIYAPGGRDPMRLPTAPAGVGEEPVAGPRQIHVEMAVTGILYSEDRPAAIVDTKLVREGQQISGATVKRIEADSIEFEMNGRTWKQTIDK